MNYLLSVIFMFLLAYYLTRSKIGSLFAGIMFITSPYLTAHQGYVTLRHTEWLPLFILSLYLWKDKPVKCFYYKYSAEITGRWHKERKLLIHNSWFYMVCSALLYACNLSGDGYYGYYACIIAFLFIMWHLAEFSLRQIACFVVLCGLLTLPVALWSCSVWLPRLDIPIGEYTANWRDYFVNTGGSLEHRLQIHPALWVFALLGLRRADKFFLVLGVVAFGLSMTAPLVPVFRCSCRFGVVVLLSLCVMAGYGVGKWIEKKDILG